MQGQGFDPWSRRSQKKKKEKKKKKTQRLIQLIEKAVVEEAGAGRTSLVNHDDGCSEGHPYQEVAACVGTLTGPLGFWASGEGPPAPLISGPHA